MACQTTATTRTTPASHAPAASAKPTATPLPGVLATATPGSTPTATVGPLVATPSPTLAEATLSGHVRVPATIISNNGAGLGPVSKLISDHGLGVVSNNGAGVIGNNGAGVISNNGGSVIGNNGAGYRLATLPADGPLGGTTVRLLDASGQQVKDAAGVAITTKTDADGAYAFRVPLAARSYLVAVDVPGGRGELAAIAAREVVTAATPAGRAVDVNLVSTLSTGYLVTAYVASQADREAALGKLPASVEAATRDTTRQALAAAAFEGPPQLSRDAVVATVDALRLADARLNSQLAMDRCLMVVAGDCDLREGELGTTVPMGVGGIVLSPDGALYINDLNKNVVWRLDVDGRVRTLYRGPDGGGVVLKLAQAVAIDAAGRVLLTDRGAPAPNYKRVTRLEPDGRLATLWTGSQEPKALFGGPGDEALLLTADGHFLAIAAGQAPREVHVVAGPDLAAVHDALGFGGTDARGRIYLATRRQGRPAVVRLDPATLALSDVIVADVANAPGDPVTNVGVDVSGNVFSATRAGKLSVLRPDGTQVSLLDALPAGLALSQELGLAYGVDGKAYLGRPNGVQRIAANKSERVVGVEAGSTVPGEADLKPYGIAVGTDGTLFVGEAQTLGDAHCHLYRYAPGKPRETLAGDGTGGFDGPARQAKIGNVPTIHLGPGGLPYLVEDPGNSGLRVLGLSADGHLFVASAAPADAKLRDFSVEADGALLVIEELNAGTGTRIVRVLPDGTRTVLLTPQKIGNGNVHAAAAPSGGLYLASASTLGLWTAETGFTSLVANAPFASATNVVVAPDGRVYVGRDGTAVWRFDGVGQPIVSIAVPAPKKPALLAGGGGPVFGPDGAMYITSLFGGEVLRVEPAQIGAATN